MTTTPFPTNLWRTFSRDAIHVIAHDETGEPTAVCVRTESVADCAIALALLKDRPGSFVLHRGPRDVPLRCSPDGVVSPYDPARPRCAGELDLTCTVEWVRPGPCPWLYVFTSSQKEWETARLALRHLLQAEKISPRSYLEGVHPTTGRAQGVHAWNLDGTPHRPEVVAQYREAAYRAHHAARV